MKRFECSADGLGIPRIAPEPCTIDRPCSKCRADMMYEMAFRPSTMPDDIPPMPKPPNGLIMGTPHFDVSTPPDLITAWLDECRKWKIQYGGWQ